MAVSTTLVNPTAWVSQSTRDFLGTNSRVMVEGVCGTCKGAGTRGVERATLSFGNESFTATGKLESCASCGGKGRVATPIDLRVLARVLYDDMFALLREHIISRPAPATDVPLSAEQKTELVNYVKTQLTKDYTFRNELAAVLGDNYTLKRAVLGAIGEELTDEYAD